MAAPSSPPPPLFAPKPHVHFSIDDDDEGESSDSTGLLTTARSSPAPPPHASTSASKYTDDLPSRTDSPLFDLDSEPDATSPYSSSSHSKRDSTSYYPPQPLKSTIPSREAAFDEDTDELEHSMDELEEPLMEGLLGTSRESLEARRNVRLKANEEGQNPPDWLTKGAGVMAGVANMSNSILGAGIVGLPYALREAGLCVGLVLLISLGVVTDYTIRLIVLNAKMSGRRTYIDIMDTCFGRPGRAAVSFFQFSFAFGGMCAFCVILGDTIPRVLVAIVPGDPGPIASVFMSRQFVVAFLTIAVSFPLSLYRDIEKLSKASALALISMVVIVVSVALRGPGVEDSLKGDPAERWSFIRPGVFEAIGVISFAFVCHHNSLLIYGSLRVPTLDRFAQVTHVSTALSVIACLCMSTSGFLVFTNITAGNILNNFAPDDTLINIARACFGANMFATLPLEAFVCREVLENYFWPEEEYNQRRHVIITTSLVGSAMLVSLMTCDLGVILELAGGFSATALAYIFPAACYLRLSDNSRKNAGPRLAAWICAAFGVAVMILSTVLSISKQIAGTSHKVC